jgi:hypothetical protein
MYRELGILILVLLSMGLVYSQEEQFDYMGDFIVTYQGAEHFLTFYADGTAVMKAAELSIDDEATILGISTSWNNGPCNLTGTWHDDLNDNIGDVNLRRDGPSTATGFTGTVKLPGLAPRTFNGRRVE